MGNEETIKKLSSSINYLASINYTIIENQEKLKNNNGLIVGRDSIFDNKKSIYQENLENKFDAYAEVRNDLTASIESILYLYDWNEAFKLNSMELFSLLQELSEEPLDYSMVFSDDCGINKKVFGSLFTKIENDASKTWLKNKLKMELLIFTTFYKDFRKWTALTDVYESLINDVNCHGSKTLMYGFPKSKKIYKLNRDDFFDYVDEIFAFVNKEDKKIKKDNSGPAQATREKLDQLVNAIDVLLDRSKFSTENALPFPRKIINSVEDFLFSNTKNKFHIDDFYAHEFELEDIYYALLLFPELEQLAKKLLAVLERKNVYFSENKTKENT